MAPLCISRNVGIYIGMVGQFESFNCKCPSKTIINKVGHIREISFCSLPCFYFLLIFKQKSNGRQSRTRTDLAP